jgi:hypothetical protein
MKVPFQLSPATFYIKRIFGQKGFFSQREVFVVVTQLSKKARCTMRTFWHFEVPGVMFRVENEFFLANSASDPTALASRLEGTKQRSRNPKVSQCGYYQETLEL